ncbi:MAG: undecaprenyl-diphosphate phosphatase [archaeon]|nr:undecaprenyl-diphosphate phosphatase [archaeon]
MGLEEAIVLGALQGILEWLPISSQGQVTWVMLNVFGHTPAQALSESIFLHIGTLLAATVYFRKDVARIITGKENQTRMFLAAALAGTAITGAISYLILREILGAPLLFTLVIGISLIITGIVQQKRRLRFGGKMTPKNGFFVGLAQGFSIIPGVSRSGTSTSALLFEGFKLKDAFRLSFILSIPTIAVAEAFFALEGGIIVGTEQLVALGVAAIVGFLSIGILLNLVEKLDFSKFCIGLGLIYLGIALL